jgi:hypothetical protein
MLEMLWQVCRRFRSRCGLNSARASSLISDSDALYGSGRGASVGVLYQQGVPVNDDIFIVIVQEDG